jgi:hypothetical protein
MTPIAPLIEAFLNETLTCQRGAASCCPSSDRSIALPCAQILVAFHLPVLRC